MKLISSLFFFLLSLTISAQKLICSDQDKKAFDDKIREIQNLKQSDFGDTMILVGQTFLGTPYVAKTLEIGESESLVINLQGMDCTTYVENVLAFSTLLMKDKMNFDSFASTLEYIRYKDGKLDGYASRLHYFSEWIVNNVQKKLLEDVTAEIGGLEIKKDINFMSTHRDLYPFLEDEENFKKIKASENYLNNQSICILPQDQIEANENQIINGDIIALTTSITGLDITHTGIAIREKDGRIHLLHASSSGKVEVSELPLVDYLKKIKKNTGIMVARPL
ncbi:MAG: N-acetylmuramoyl-L-alanine amidase-like domain-containing protein [Eudoraea sp.]|uniref:N-acetylmuramoyl-L-alanine amidase-like domain-containing protein n=1 Tax=Eudoraea sp. TaxID=1979955 RepID=UPI003C72CEF1